MSPPAPAKGLRMRTPGSWKCGDSVSSVLLNGLKEVCAVKDRDRAANLIRLAGDELLRHEVHPVPEGSDQTYCSVTVER